MLTSRGPMGSTEGSDERQVWLAFANVVEVVWLPPHGSCVIVAPDLVDIAIGSGEASRALCGPEGGVA